MKAEIKGGLATRRILLDVAFHRNFARGVFGAHVADEAKDGAFGSPKTIIATKNPEDPAVGIRIASIETIFVVEFDHDGGGAHRRGIAIANTNRQNREQKIFPRIWREAGGNHKKESEERREAQRAEIACRRESPSQGVLDFFC
jgi:hypothetical protein